MRIFGDVVESSRTRSGKTSARRFFDSLIEKLLASPVNIDYKHDDTVGLPCRDQQTPRTPRINKECRGYPRASECRRAPCLSGERKAGSRRRLVATMAWLYGGFREAS